MNTLNFINPNSIYMECQELDCSARVCTKSEITNLLLTFINLNTTPAAFDAFCKEIPNFHITKGSYLGLTSMHAAAGMGNATLIQHIWNVAGVDRSTVLNLNDQLYYTPLHCSVGVAIGEVIEEGVSAADATAAAKKLIHLGANVNMLSPKQLTPLDRALQSKTENLSLIQSLIFNGGKGLCRLNAMQTARLQKALKPVFEHFKCLCLGKTDEESLFYTLPNDIVKLLIDNYRLA